MADTSSAVMLVQSFQAMMRAYPVNAHTHNM